MTTRGDGTESIEVWLSQPDLEITCRIVFHDGMAVAVGVDALSIPAAQYELTGWLREQGYQPAGRWSSAGGNGSETARIFRPRDHQNLPGVFPVLRPLAPDTDPPGLERGPPPGPAPRQVPRARRAAEWDAPARYSREAVEEELRAWARTYTRRNEVIRAADAAGISVDRIQQLTGLARTTIMRILGSPPSRGGWGGTHRAPPR